MALAQIGMFTAAAEALATAIGAGMVLGAFGAGAIGILAGLPRQHLEERAFICGYFAGIGSTFLVLVDLLVLVF